MESIQDIFGRMRTLLPKGRVLSERAETIKWFSEKMQRPPKLIGIRLAHLTQDHLYSIQSEYRDISNRRGSLPALKYLWAITKTTKYEGVQK